MFSPDFESKHPQSLSRPPRPHLTLLRIVVGHDAQGGKGGMEHGGRGRGQERPAGAVMAIGGKSGLRVNDKEDSDGG